MADQDDKKPKDESRIKIELKPIDIDSMSPEDDLVKYLKDHPGIILAGCGSSGGGCGSGGSSSASGGGSGSGGGGK